MKLFGSLVIRLFFLWPIVSNADGTYNCSESWKKIYFQSISYELRTIEAEPLQSIMFGENDKEIRIWKGFGLVPLSGRFISNRSGNWDLSSFSSSRPLNLVSKMKDDSLLWEELEGLGFFELPDDCELENKLWYTDGTSYVVEIKTHEFYRTYQYGNPESQSIEEAKYFLKLMKRIDNAFL